jgi:hypothetical protein
MKNKHSSYRRVRVNFGEINFFVAADEIEHTTAKDAATGSSDDDTGGFSAESPDLSTSNAPARNLNDWKSPLHSGTFPSFASERRPSSKWENAANLERSTSDLQRNTPEFQRHAGTFASMKQHDARPTQLPSAHSSIGAWELLQVRTLQPFVTSSLLPTTPAFVQWLSNCPAQAMKQMSLMEKQAVASLFAQFSVALFESDYFKK